jgi:hypothetical protein
MVTLETDFVTDGFGTSPNTSAESANLTDLLLED